MSLPTNESLVRRKRLTPAGGPAVSDDDIRSSKGFEEAAKLTATYMNGSAIGILVTGMFTVASASATLSLWEIAGYGAICFGTSVGTHAAARRYIRRELRHVQS